MTLEDEYMEKSTLRSAHTSIHVIAVSLPAARNERVKNQNK